jgi:hypothetical protein
MNVARSERKSEDRERYFCTGRELSSSPESLSVVRLNEYKGESEAKVLYIRAAMMMNMNNFKRRMRYICITSETFTGGL